jgi:hypothetical protein
MLIEVLFFRGCPNHIPTVSLVRSVVRDLGITASISEIEVNEPSEALRLRFLGSPTVKVEGEDIETERRGDQDYGLSCRMYGSSGVPSREMIASALARKV